MLPSLASHSDLEEWMGVEFNDGLQVSRAEAILSAASTLVRTHTGRIWVDADGEPEEDVDETKLLAAQQVVVMVAERVFTNPQGITQQQSGPFSKSVASWAALGMALTDDEKSMIGGSIGSLIPGLSSVRVLAPAAAAGSRSGWWWLTEEEEGDL